MSTALVTNTGNTNNVPHTPAPTNHDSGRPIQVAVPEMRSKYLSTQSASGLCVLPNDVEPLILNQLGKGVFNFGLTCKYWNLNVREFLTQKPAGKKLLREKYEKDFRKEHRMSVVNAFRALSGTSFMKFFEFDDSIMGKNCLDKLRTSKEPVYLVSPRKGHWMSTDLKSALASRGCKLTIIEIDAPDDASMRSLIGAINAIPSNGFATLCLSSATLSSPHVAELWDAISSHPVVAHIECTGNNVLATGDQVVAMITLLAEKGANVSSYSLNSCRLDEQSRDVLTVLLSAKNGIVELEVCELNTSVENMENLFAAVRARNGSNDSRMALRFAAGNAQDLIDPRQSSVLTADGINIRKLGEQWFIQEDPIEKQSIEKQSARDESDDDDSSIVVGSYSSGDDNYGSEFDSSDNEA